MSPLFVALSASIAVGLAFPLGALLSRLNPFGHTGFAAAMAAGAGLLLAVALSDLLPHAGAALGVGGAAAAFVLAAALYSLVNRWLATRGARHRKRCGGCKAPPAESEQHGSGTAIVVGTVMDAVPEAVVLGTAAATMGVSPALLAALVLGNAAQSMSATSGLRVSGRSPRFVWSLWLAVGAGVVALSLLACLANAALPDAASPALMAVAAGALVAMTAEAMLPEAAEQSPAFTGLLAAAGAAVFILIGA